MDIVNRDKNTTTAYFAGRGFSLNHQIDAKEVASFINLAGDVNPTEIVELATPPGSPIHKYFEWDNKIAGHKYRLQQARYLVLAIQIVDPVTETSVRAFESVVIDGKRAYVSARKIAQSEDLITQVVERALEELRYWSEKHQNFKKFFGGIFDEIKKAEEAWRNNEKTRKEQKLGAKPGRKVVKANRAADKKTNGKHNNRRRLPTSRK